MMAVITLKRCALHRNFASELRDVHLGDGYSKCPTTVRYLGFYGGRGGQRVSVSGREVLQGVQGQSHSGGLGNEVLHKLKRFCEWVH